MSLRFKPMRGFFYGVIVILLFIPLFLFIFSYQNISKTPGKDREVRARCDKLYYYLQDLRKDLSRA
ncbi:MAG TPA: hypothetical protein ENG50_05735, partial [Candidatus Altiarchaeales archaeon]|nr:hypothetical protein [Candidatus Altiarchaeales archaeon]